MLKHKVLLFLFQIKLLLCNCHTEIRESGFTKGKRHTKTQLVGHLPSEVNESSGLVKLRNQSALLTLNDGGGKAEVYQVDSTGQLLQVVPIPRTHNTDWEDLTQDTQDNWYIGDIGNNQQNRKDLCIYKVSVSSSSVDTIKFSYQNQRFLATEPPIYDSEALLWHRDSLYIFSKNRGDNRMVHLYAMPAQSGTYSLMSQDSIFLKTQVTGAVLRPDGGQMAILTYGKVFLFDVSDGRISFKKPTKCIKFAHRQTEAITYWDAHNLLITNEQGQVFRLQLKN
ncbi:MAG: hypothetical protein U0Y10_01705 [Spirosomataceae bacterium]